MPSEKHHSSGTWSMLMAGLPPSMVGCMCHGASRWVPLCVVRLTRSNAGPCPSRICSRLSPGKISMNSLAPAAWSESVMDCAMCGGSDTMPFFNATDKSMMRMASSVFHGNDREQQRRGTFHVVINPVQRRLAAANVVRDIFDVGGAGDAGRQIKAGDVEANAVAFAE